MMIYYDNRVANVRSQFADLLFRRQFVTDKTGVKTIEITGVSFIADEDHIFGAVNHDYVKRELLWYLSESRFVDDIPGGPPPIWKAVSGKEEPYIGMINSNYGWMIFSVDNHNQYWDVLAELEKNPLSRRAVMIYTRPTMHMDYNTGGMSDFVCTNTVQYLIRDGYLDVVVQMRSNDAWAGYRNDYAWQKWVQDALVARLKDSYPDLQAGIINWQVGSLHVYEKDFYLVHHYEHSGETHITKKEFIERYGEQNF